MKYEISMITKEDEKYPSILRGIHAPSTLYYMGDISITEQKCIAVIGQRKSDDRTLQIAKNLGAKLADNGYVVLNGLALGCDKYAVEGALSAGGKVVAIMAGGLNKIYPASCQDTARKILESGGCIISQYAPDVKPNKIRFVERDKTQAQLSKKIIVVDCRIKGGTMHTVEYGVQERREIGCFMETMRPSAEGNSYIVNKYHAYSIHDTDELLHFVSIPEYEQVGMAL